MSRYIMIGGFSSTDLRFPIEVWLSGLALLGKQSRERYHVLTGPGEGLEEFIRKMAPTVGLSVEVYPKITDMFRANPKVLVGFGSNSRIALATRKASRARIPYYLVDSSWGNN